MSSWRQFRHGHTVCEKGLKKIFPQKNKKTMTAFQKSNDLTANLSLLPAVYTDKSLPAQQSPPVKNFTTLLAEAVSEFLASIDVKPDSHYAETFCRAFRAVALEIDVRETLRVVIGVESASIALHANTKPVFFIDSTMTKQALCDIVSHVYDVLVQTMDTYTGAELIIADADRVHAISGSFQGGNAYPFHGYNPDHQLAGWKQFVYARQDIEARRLRNISCRIAGALARFFVCVPRAMKH